ncbi:hypothetical protein RI129_013139 [Pyrocoelia pectoralis]|uniref:Peptidase S1 domain-containing protein n=1 Tax=Pyrocoelia pectoralis TaxID=417401 RepID=A0AAN7V2F0_9COLE
MIYKIVITILGLLFLSAEGLELGHLKSRIIGGTIVPVGKYPFVVSLTNATGHHCGGAIIGENCVLTNGRCSLSARKNTTVVAGTNNLKLGGKVYQVYQTFQPPGYNNINYMYNIGVVKIVGKFTFDNTTMPIRLSTSDPPVGSSCTLPGWGLHSWPSTTMSTDLYEISLKRIPDLVCNRTSQKEFPLIYKFCTENNYKHAPCTGDLGGPLVCDNEVKGTVSTLKECGTGYPDTHEKVVHWRDWIESVCKIKHCPK